MRVLQEGEIERLGGTQTIKVNVRVEAATNRDLEKACEEGKFREDLYYRLNVFPIICPSLRSRRDDIPPLVNHFIQKYNLKAGKDINSVPQKAMNSLKNYHWPGNVRELENIIERAVVISDGELLQLGDWLSKKTGPASRKQVLNLDELQKNHILQILDMTHWRVRGKEGAAQLLGINPTTLESRMQKLGIKK